MKQESIPARRAAWLFLAAPALLAIPAHAQDAPTQELTPPPPVTRTVPQGQAPATAPADTSAPTASSARGTDPASRTTIAPGAGDVVDDARIAARPERRASAPRETRRVAATRTAAPAAAAPSATTAPAPTSAETAQPAPAPAAAPDAPASTTAAPATPTTETATTRTESNDRAPLWPLAAIVAAILAIGAFFLFRRRKADDLEDATYYEEPVYEEPVVAAEPARAVAPAPIAAEPVTAVAPAAAAAAVTAAAHDRADEPAAAGLADDATVTDAPAEDVAALTEGAPPVRNRPWLELAMRPVRAGTSAEEALVEIELTVANSGTMTASDVRVSTFMLTDAHASEMERVLVDAPADAAIDPVTIEPGEGTRIDATLAALKSDLGAEGRFTPVVVADARYRLPDGTEGRTSASFVVGVSDEQGGTLIPIDLADRVMRDDVEARLHGEPEHA